MRGIWVVCDLNYFTAIGHFFFSLSLQIFRFHGKNCELGKPKPHHSVWFALSFGITHFISNSYEAFFFFVLPKQFFFSI